MNDLQDFIDSLDPKRSTCSLGDVFSWRGFDGKMVSVFKDEYGFRVSWSHKGHTHNRKLASVSRMRSYYHWLHSSRSRVKGVKRNVGS